MRQLELLAPAKDLPTGIAAIDCGADAVYIGAEKFSARAAAGNSVEDIAQIVCYAHKFRVKVYVALNTVIFDDELEEVRALVEKMVNIGVDALLVQDMAMLSLTQESGIPLHASTQSDNRTKEKVGWLKALGFTRVVLARELSLEQIRAIHEAHPDVELEAFVHGSLCVSYSGACYASQHFFSRSANRGECAQFCRMKFDLVDSAGSVIRRGSHLLSLKDLCLFNYLEELADAGVTSFKIEGRLKDVAYVKNVVSAYSKQLDKLCSERKGDFERSSVGTVEYSFNPDLNKTFNRGYTDYFFNGRKPNISSPNTPKAMGENVGVVKEIWRNSFTVASLASFANGDGLCFINENNELEGFRINTVEGNRLFPHNMPTTLKKGMELYRNNDMAFEKLLSRQVATRRIPINLTLNTTPNGFSLKAESKEINAVKVDIAFPHEQAKKPQGDNIKVQLSKWGDTIYKVVNITIEGDADECFIPSSLLSTLRHNLAIALDKQGTEYKPDVHPRSMAHIKVEREQTEALSLPLMQCKHCLRYSLGYCVKHGGKRPTWYEPLFLRMRDGRQVRLSFDCNECQMNVLSLTPTSKTL